MSKNNNTTNTEISEEEINKILSEFNTQSTSGLRNKSLVSLLASTGIRTKELIELKWKLLDLNNQVLQLENRILKIDDQSISLLKDWKKTQLDKVGKIEYVFSTITKSHKTGRPGQKGETKPGKPLKARYIRRMIKKYVKKAGIDKNITPRTFRTTYGCNLYRETRNLEAVKKKLGLSTMANARMYRDIVKKKAEDVYRKLMDLDW